MKTTKEKVAKKGKQKKTEENRKNKRDPSEKKENNVNTTPFTSKKVVPIVLEENELKR